MRDRKAEILKNKEIHKLQGAMWNQIDQLSEKFHTKSYTDNLGDVIDYVAKENNFNDIDSKLNNECNGYIVFGTERPFIELFKDNKSRKHYIA